MNFIFPPNFTAVWFELLFNIGGIIDIIQTSDFFHSQYVVDGSILFSAWYFALKYKPFYDMVMPAVLWVDSLLDRLANILARLSLERFK